MEMACGFFNSSEGSVPFNYLSLPVGADLRKIVKWEPLLGKLKGKFNFWARKCNFRRSDCTS